MNEFQEGESSKLLGQLLQKIGQLGEGECVVQWVETDHLTEVYEKVYMVEGVESDKKVAWTIWRSERGWKFYIEFCIIQEANAAWKVTGQTAECYLGRGQLLQQRSECNGEKLC